MCIAGTVVSADAGFHTEHNLKHLEATGVDAYVADTLFRKRDPRFATAERHKPSREPDPDRLFGPEDFHFDEAARRCICPAGKRLYANGSNVVIRGLRGMKFCGAKRDCGPCPLRARCLRNPERTPVRRESGFVSSVGVGHRFAPESWSTNGYP